MQPAAQEERRTAGPEPRRGRSGAIGARHRRCARRGQCGSLSPPRTRRHRACEGKLGGISYGWRISSWRITTARRRRGGLAPTATSPAGGGAWCAAPGDLHGHRGDPRFRSTLGPAIADESAQARKVDLLLVIGELAGRRPVEEVLGPGVVLGLPPPGDLEGSPLDLRLVASPPTGSAGGASRGEHPDDGGSKPHAVVSSLSAPGAVGWPR